MTNEQFNQYAQNLEKVDAKGLSVDVENGQIVITKEAPAVKNEEDFIVTISSDEGVLTITNGKDALGYDFELRDVNEESLDEIIEAIKSGAGFTFNQKFLTERCGEYVDSF